MWTYSNSVHVQASDGYVNDFSCKELAGLVVRHRGCLIGALDSITSTWWRFIGVVLWVCMRPGSCIAQLSGIWGIYCSCHSGLMLKSHTRAPTHIVKVLVPQHRKHQGGSSYCPPSITEPYDCTCHPDSLKQPVSYLILKTLHAKTAWEKGPRHFSIKNISQLTKIFSGNIIK